MPVSAQCFGKEKVIELFENRGLDAWSIWCGKQFLFTGIGSDELDSQLEMILAGTNSVYTLKVYRSITDAEEITEKTPAAGSFNFYPREKFESPSRENGAAKTIGAVHRLIEEKVAEKIADALDRDERPDKKQSIGDILQDPDQIKEWIGVISLAKTLLSGNPQQESIPMQLGNVGNVTRVEEAQEVEKEYSERDQIRLTTAINILGRNDPKIIDHLEKLARMSQTNKPMFDNLIMMLNAMP